MFRNTYQRGFLVVFSSSGSKPLEIWDVVTKNGHAKRVTDVELKQLCFELMGVNVATTFMVAPRCPCPSLAVKLPFLVLLVKNMKKFFSFEIQILDDRNLLRRFRASNYQSATRVDNFCTVMPLALTPGWNQIQFNLADFTRRAYGTNYIETVRIQIHANVRVKRVYFSDRLYPDDELPAHLRLHPPPKMPRKKLPKEAVETVRPPTPVSAPAKQSATTTSSYHEITMEFKGNTATVSISKVTETSKTTGRGGKVTKDKDADKTEKELTITNLGEDGPMITIETSPKGAFPEVREMFEAMGNAFTEKKDAFQGTKDVFKEVEDAFEEKRDAFPGVKGVFEEMGTAFTEKKDAFPRVEGVLEEMETAFKEKKDAFPEVKDVFKEMGDASKGGKDPFQEVEGLFKEMEEKGVPSKKKKGDPKDVFYESHKKTDTGHVYERHEETFKRFDL